MRPCWPENPWQRRFDLISGKTMTTAVEAATLDRMLREMDARDAELLSNFTGTVTTHEGVFRARVLVPSLAAGVGALRAVDPCFRIAARCVIQRRNYLDLPNVIDTARRLGLNQVSFLAADVSTTAFNRPTPWDGERVADVALTQEEVAEFRRLLDETIVRYASDFASGFIAESPAKLRALARYFAALLGEEPFPETICNAPWVSAVVEADGTVRPCFFHRALGNIHERPLDVILNSPTAIAFRRQLDVSRDPTCVRCVCTLHLPSTTRLPKSSP